MMRALSGVLAKKALKGVLSKNGKAKLALKEAPERELKQDPFYALEKMQKNKYIKKKNEEILKRKNHERMSHE